MKRNLLINIKYNNIDLVAECLTYHSGQKRIFLAENGSSVIFISFNKFSKKHEVVGYFIVVEKYIDEQEPRWGKYTVKGISGKFVKGKDFSKVIKSLHLKIGNGEPDAKEIGMATQTIREIDDHDKQLLLNYVEGL